MNVPVSGNKVTFPTHEFTPFKGGIAVYIEEMAKACSEAGADVVVVSPNYAGQDAHPVPYRVVRVSMRGSQDWLCRWRLGNALVRETGRGVTRGTIVLAEPGPLRWWMYSALTRPPRADRLVIVFHGSELKMLTSNPVWKWLLGRVLDKTDCVGVVSGPIRDLAVAAFPQLVGKVKLVPGAVRSWMRDIPLADWNTRRQEILQVGRIHPRKGQLELIEAFGRLPSDIRQQFCVRLVGPQTRPEYARKVHEAAERASVRIEMDGEIADTELIKAYQRARLLVMPSRLYKNSVEGLGLALLEAQHFGLPVIATRTGGVADAMVPDKTGFLVEPGDRRLLSNAIQQVLQDPDMAAGFGQNGRRFVNEAFSWERNARVLGLI